MFAEEDSQVDSQLGYPPVYAKLCRHAMAVELPMPFTEGAPQRFLPYSPQAEDFLHLKDWDNVFPVVAERERDSSSTRKYAEELWQQLDHLGNAGFDPAKFRVDQYGNVVYWNADISSPLAWDIDHWFPFPRGGKTVLPNLRIVQWQACSRKRNRLEFLVPWWDLQHGCSINQFLSAFAAKNADFRKRSFALFFAGGQDEAVAREHVGECRPWPQQFREKKALCGLAAAAIVSVSKDSTMAVAKEVGGPSKDPSSSDVPRILGSYPHGAVPGTSSKRLWSAEEEEALKRGVNKFGPGSWKEIKEDDVILANRSVAHIKEKFRLMRGGSRNVARESNSASKNGLSGRQSAATTALQKELRVKIMREEERREREEELARLEDTVMKLKHENEKERLKAGDLESLLKKHKYRLEKQRKWAESQSSYRLCLERVLRDTMHQTMSYKEQARLTREACNVLIARLDSQKASCEAMEHELLQRHSQREILEAAAGVNTSVMLKKLATEGRGIVDVSSCVSLRATAADEDEDEDEDEEEKLVMTANQLWESESEDEEDGDDEVYVLRREHQHQAAARNSLVRHAIKVAMQVEDTKEAGDLPLWEVPGGFDKPSCPIQALEHVTESRRGGRGMEQMSQIHQQYDTDCETSESECDSDFADDEMSPALRLSGDDDTTLVAADLIEFQHEGPTTNSGYSSRNSKPSGDNDLIMVLYNGFEHGHQSSASCEPANDTVSTSESQRSDHSKQEVQKDVIMVQQTDSFKDVKSTDTTALYKQEYLDELLHQIRFQIPTSEVTVADDNGPPFLSEGHLDALLEQALRNHLDNVRRSDSRQRQQQQQQQQQHHHHHHHQSAEVDDEKLKEIGKSNLDKWLQVLLFKEVESTCSSPGRDTPLPIVSPAVTQISVAAMRESLERASHQELLARDGEDAERPKGLWGAFLRKLTVKHQSEQSLLFDPKDEHHTPEDSHNFPRLSSQEADIANAMISLLQTSPNRQPTSQYCNGSATLAEGRHCNAACTLPGWPGGIQQLGGMATNYWPKDDNDDDDDDDEDDDDNNKKFRQSPHSQILWKTGRRAHDGVHVEYTPHSLEKRYFNNPLSDVDEISETESLNSQPQSTSASDRKEIPRHKKRVSIKVAGFVGWKKSTKKGDASKVQEKPPAQAIHVE